MAWVEETKQGCVIRILAQPKASKTEIVGLHGDPPRLKIRVAAPPVEGAANEELQSFLSKQLGIAKSAIRLLRGNNSRQKDFLLECPKAIELAQRLLLR